MKKWINKVYQALAWINKPLCFNIPFICSPTSSFFSSFFGTTQGCLDHFSGIMGIGTLLGYSGTSLLHTRRTVHRKGTSGQKPNILIVNGYLILPTEVFLPEDDIQMSPRYTIHGCGAILRPKPKRFRKSGIVNRLANSPIRGRCNYFICIANLTGFILLAGTQTCNDLFCRHCLK